MKKEELKLWLNKSELNRSVFNALHISQKLVCASDAITFDTLDSFVWDVRNTMRSEPVRRYIKEFLVSRYGDRNWSDDNIDALCIDRRNTYPNDGMDDYLYGKNCRRSNINYKFDNMLRNFRRYIRELHARSFNTQGLYTFSRQTWLKQYDGNWNTLGWKKFNRSTPGNITTLMFIEDIPGLGPVFMHDTQMYIADQSAYSNIIPIESL